MKQKEPENFIHIYVVNLLEKKIQKGPEKDFTKEN